MRLCMSALIVVTTLAAVPGLATSWEPGGQEFSWRGNPNRDAYDRGYREGYKQGEQDARRNRYELGRDSVFRDGDRGYDDRYGTRDRYRRDFRRGYEEGYRAAFDRLRGSSYPYVRRPDRGGYQDPAFARGYSEGYSKGADDGRDGDRYDAVRHGAYRDGDNGYFRNYGSRDAYKNNYRAGFRQGYEEGYRDGARAGRRSWPY
jgi:flagellar biosynthesis/type III secretory pathway protein FliH